MRPPEAEPSEAGPARAVDEDVRGRDEEHSQRHRDAEATEDGAGEWRVGFAARPKLEGHRQQADDRSERGHKYRAQANAARHGDGLADFHALAAQVPGEFD